MKYREKLGYIALGGFLMLVGMLAAGVMLPLGAQSARVDMDFGKITCTKLAVVDADGKEGVSLSNSRRGGEIFVRGKHSYVWVANNEHGGHVGVLGKDGSGVQLSNDEHGGVVEVHSRGTGAWDTKVEGKWEYDKDDLIDILAFIQQQESKYGAISARARMSVNEYGTGAVSTWDKNGYRLATLK